MRILIVGEWKWTQYEDAFAKGLEANGIRVSRFSTSRFFSGILGKIQLILPILPGWSLIRLNKSLIRYLKKNRHDLVLFWRPTHFLPHTISKIHSLGIHTASYNNDDPFNYKDKYNPTWHYHYLWYWYHKCIPIFEKNYFYRYINCQEALLYGARHAELLMPYFIPWRDRPMVLSMNDKLSYETDVVFVGHYEHDGRAQSIHALLDLGINVKIWGDLSWSRNLRADIFRKLQPIMKAEGINYAKALSGSKICLAFLSKFNRDTYTRRCFEIPACGSVMLAERTNDLLSIFEEDKEACFFSSTEELIEKVKWLLNSPDLREHIALAGRRRVILDGHDVYSRAKKFIYSIQL